MRSIIRNIPSNVTIEGSTPLLCEAQLLSEVPDTTVEFHGGDRPKAEMPYIPKDSSAFSHRGLPRKKRR